MGAAKQSSSSSKSGTGLVAGSGPGLKQVKSCSECNTTKTPLWRSGPAGPKTLCNACGIKYNKKRRQKLAVTKKEKKRATAVSAAHGGDGGKRKLVSPGEESGVAKKEKKEKEKKSATSIAAVHSGDSGESGGVKESLKRKPVSLGGELGGVAKKEKKSTAAAQERKVVSLGGELGVAKKEKKSAAVHGGDDGGESGGLDESLKRKLVSLGSEIILRGKRSGKVLSTLREEEQAAMLLMALSCDSVSAY